MSFFNILFNKCMQVYNIHICAITLTGYLYFRAFCFSLVLYLFSMPKLFQKYDKLISFVFEGFFLLLYHRCWTFFSLFLKKKTTNYLYGERVYFFLSKMMCSGILRKKHENLNGNPFDNNSVSLIFRFLW